MDYNDIRQLRLYARYDGFYASILLLGSFACFLALSLTATGSWAWMGLTSLCPLIVLLTPIFIYRRLCKFRDEGLGGTISAKRALLYVLVRRPMRPSSSPCSSISTSRWPTTVCWQAWWSVSSWPTSSRRR